MIAAEQVSVEDYDRLLSRVTLPENRRQFPFVFLITALDEPNDEEELTRWMEECAPSALFRFVRMGIYIEVEHEVEAVLFKLRFS